MMIKVVSPLYKFLRDEELLQVSQLQVTYEQKDKDLHQWPDVHPLIGAYTRVAESVLSCLQNMKSMHSDYHHRACSSINYDCNKLTRSYFSDKEEISIQLRLILIYCSLCLKLKAYLNVLKWVPESYQYTGKADKSSLLKETSVMVWS